MSDDELLKSLRETGEFLMPFNQIAKALTSTIEPREVLAIVVQQVSSVLHPSSWSLLLDDPKTGELYFEIAVGEGAEKLKSVRMKRTEGIAGAAFTTGEVQLVYDAKKNVVALPLKARGRVLGVLELVDGLNAATKKEDLQALRSIADYAAIAIDNALNFQRIQELTLTDEHTGLYNTRHLYEMLNREVERASRFDRPISLVFMDLDHFKEVNDAHGHLAGTAVLREVGEVLKTTIRKVDAAFRYGGDEFALLLVETDANGARVVSHRILNRLRHHVFLADRGKAVRITASVGIATFPDDARAVDELLHAADRAMYRAKAIGRDEVVLTSDLGHVR
jgi:diguanylate cyclase (GGDEF)-like protein